jgi:sulfur carrier protein ThiS
MNVELECIANLAKSGECSFTERTSYTLPEGKTVADLVGKAKLSLQDVETVIVNHAIACSDTVLSDGDRVELVPVFGMR